ncbi:hypothetical protein NBRC116597_28670 [Phaeobacter sp. NW0010-22]
MSINENHATAASWLMKYKKWRRRMKIYVTHVFADDQDKAETFYTEVLGFKVKNNVPLGEHR